MVVERCGDTSPLVFNLRGFSSCSTARQQRSGFNIATGVEAGGCFPQILQLPRLKFQQLPDIPAGPVKTEFWRLCEDMVKKWKTLHNCMLTLLMNCIARLLRPKIRTAFMLNLNFRQTRIRYVCSWFTRSLSCFSSITGKGTEEQYQRIAPNRTQTWLRIGRC